MIDLSTIQVVQLAALFIAGIAASFKFQYQALFYVLVVVNACTDFPSFALANFIFLVVLLAAGFIRGSAK